MRCREARQWRFAEAEGNLPAERQRLLRAHLACCPACAERTRMEGWLERDLAALGDAPGVEIDVTPRVLAAIGRLGPPRAERPTTRQLGWAGASAAALALLALAELAALLAGRGDAVSQLRTVARAAGAVIMAVVRPVAAVAQAFFDLTISLLQQVLEIGVSSGAIQAAGWSIVAGWLIVFSTTGVFVGRDLLRGPRLDSRKEIWRSPR